MPSPYVFCYNNPIIYKDPDGELAILINGLTSSNSERANASYWGNQIINIIKNSGIPNSSNIMFVDGNQYLRGTPLSKMDDWPRDEAHNISTAGVTRGNMTEGNSAQARNDAGYLQARADFAQILMKLATDPDTKKIVEKIQIYTHSRGAAFGAGYITGLLYEISKHADMFADPKNVIDLVFDMAPNEAGRDGATLPDGLNAYSISHGEDPLSSTWQRGTKANFHSYERVSGLLGQHSIKSFGRDLKAFVDAYSDSKGNSQALINTFIQNMSKYGIKVNVIQ
ncbi:hypothetical protein UNH65_04365 [Chitinophaga sp. 180180018-2]|nr:hypothetical protein [Chitinophaga sp. 212800010-3]